MKLPAKKKRCMNISITKALNHDQETKSKDPQGKEGDEIKN